jgi:hypothetical protein
MILLTIRRIARLRILGIAMFPFVIVARKELRNDIVFINHELIHLRHQLELLIVPFYAWYLIEYVILRFKHNHKTAYSNIVFEKEAYQNESDLTYLKTRRFWNFLQYYGN